MFEERGYGAFPLMTEVTSIHAPKIMKKSVRRLAFGALAAAAAVQFAACRNRPETVYGPPEYFTKTDPSNNVPEDVYGPPEMFETTQQGTEYDPSENVPEAVYGPPEMFDIDETPEGDIPATEFVPEENETTEAEPESTAAETTEAEPESTAAETSEEAPEPVTPETCYEPSRNEMIALYGPPEMFRQMETAVPQADEPAQGPGEAAGTGARK